MIDEFVPQALAGADDSEHHRHHVDDHVHDDHHLGLHLGGPEHERRDFMNRKQQKRMEDVRTAKDKKMKKVAAGLSVVLAIVLAFEVPSMLKSSGGGSATPPAATTDASTGVTPPATGTPTTTPPGTAAAAVTPVASAKLPNSDTLPKVGKSQLYSFSHFASKDPFVQQVAAAPET